MLYCNINPYFILQNDNTLGKNFFQGFYLASETPSTFFLRLHQNLEKKCELRFY